MSLLPGALRFVAAAVVWCCLLAAAASVTLGGFLGVHAGPYRGAAVVCGCLLVAAVVGFAAVTDLPDRAA